MVPTRPLPAGPVRSLPWIRPATSPTVCKQGVVTVPGRARLRKEPRALAVTRSQRAESPPVLVTTLSPQSFPSCRCRHPGGHYHLPVRALGPPIPLGGLDLAGQRHARHRCLLRRRPSGVPAVDRGRARLVERPRDAPESRPDLLGWYRSSAVHLDAGRPQRQRARNGPHSRAKAGHQRPLSGPVRPGRDAPVGLRLRFPS